MKEIVVTGVAGFIGSNLAGKLMASGFGVVGIDSVTSGTLDMFRPAWSSTRPIFEIGR